MKLERLIATIPSVRRLQAERDGLRQQAQRLQADTDRLRQEVRELREEAPLTWLRHRPAQHSRAARAVSGEPASRVGDAFVARVVQAYRAAVAAIPSEEVPSIWTGPLSDIKHRERALLAGGSLDEIRDLLSHPAGSMLCYGFDELIAPVAGRSDPASILVSSPQWLYDNLRRLAEAVGAVRLSNPENCHAHDKTYDVEQLLVELDDCFGVKLTFPNPYPGEVGMASSRGVISYRAIQAIYQAYRVVTLAKHPRVLEIGAGLGRTAFYLRQFGVTDYTAIDIPLSNVAHSHFLGSTLGESKVSLYGEVRKPFRILPNGALHDISDRFDLILNVDSLTEMARGTADAYWQFIADRCDLFLSINHEANEFAVRDLYRAGKPRTVQRSPYWLRRGYVEELIAFG